MRNYHCRAPAIPIWSALHATPFRKSSANFGSDVRQSRHAIVSTEHSDAFHALRNIRRCHAAGGAPTLPFASSELCSRRSSSSEKRQDHPLPDPSA